MKTVTIPTCANPFVVIVNGIKYTYPAGATVKVPDDVAKVIEQHEEAKPEPAPVQPPYGDYDSKIKDLEQQTEILTESFNTGIPPVDLTPLWKALNDPDSPNSVVNQLADLNDELGDQAADIEDIQEDIEDIQEDIEDIQDDIYDINDEVEDNEEYIYELQEIVDHMYIRFKNVPFDGEWHRIWEDGIEAHDEVNMANIGSYDFNGFAPYECNVVYIGIYNDDQEKHQLWVVAGTETYHITGGEGYVVITGATNGWRVTIATGYALQRERGWYIKVEQIKE